MMRKHPGRAAAGSKASRTDTNAPCVVCGMSDARGLVEVELTSEPCVALCGTHELMHRRSGWKASTVAELRAAFGNRRSTERRGGPGEIDELAEKLTAAFTRDRRSTSRRAG